MLDVAIVDWGEVHFVIFSLSMTQLQYKKTARSFLSIFLSTPNTNYLRGVMETTFGFGNADTDENYGVRGFQPKIRRQLLLLNSFLNWLQKM